MAVNNNSLSQSIDFNSALKTLFPKEEYKKSAKPNVVLHYYLVHSSFKAINGWVEKLDTPEKKTYLTHRSINQLSPLDICAILGKVEEANLLAEKGANCEKPDSMGRTPLHYASLVHGESCELFVTFAKAVLKTDQKVDLFLRGNDPQFLNLDRLLDRTLPKPTELVFNYQNNEKKIVPGTAEEFCKMTGAQYSDRILTTAKTAASNWLEPRAVFKNEGLLNLLKRLPIAYNVHKNSPSKIYIGKDGECPVGFDLFAGELLSTGKIICSYVGEEIPNCSIETSHEHVLSNIDAGKIRNLAAMANHGFPNAIGLTMNDVDGISEIHLLIACEPINPGDKIIWNYGIEHDVVRSANRVETRKKAFDEYLKKNTIKGLVEEFESKSKQTSFNECIAREGIREKLIYLFQDPYAFRSMIEIKKDDNKFILSVLSHLIDEKFQRMIGANNLLYIMRLFCVAEDFSRNKTINEDLFQEAIKALEVKIIIESEDV